MIPRRLRNTRARLLTGLLDIGVLKRVRITGVLAPKSKGSNGPIENFLKP